MNPRADQPIEEPHSPNPPVPNKQTRTLIVVRPCVPRPKEDTKGKRKAEEEGAVPEELLAALNFADLEGPIPPWASGGKNWDPENGGLTERHIQVGWWLLFFPCFFFLCVFTCSVSISFLNVFFEEVPLRCGRFEKLVCCLFFASLVGLSHKV